MFPEVSNIIGTLKEGDHSNFAVQLQKHESKIFIDEICKELVERDIIPFTLHEGLLVPSEHERDTYLVMCDVLFKHLGAVPEISINGTKVFYQDQRDA